MEELSFYIVDTDYIHYLRKFEKKVSYNKENVGHTRPYLGVGLKVNQYELVVKYENTFSKAFLATFYY